MSALLAEAKEDIMKTLGFARAKAMRQSRLNALTDPATYEKDRNDRMDNIETNVKAFYRNTSQSYSNSGFDTETAKVQATKDAAAYAKVKIDQLNLDFPPLTGATMAADAPRWAAAMDPYKDAPRAAAPRAAAPRARAAAAPRARAAAPAGHKKDPARVKAGKKAAKTRRENAKKKK